MKYYDKNGEEIRAGMHLRMETGGVWKIYAIKDANGNPDLGICTTHEAWLDTHPKWMGVYYSLSDLRSSLKNSEIVKG